MNQKTKGILLIAGAVELFALLIFCWVVTEPEYDLGDAALIWMFIQIVPALIMLLYKGMDLYLDAKEQEALSELDELNW